MNQPHNLTAEGAFIQAAILLVKQRNDLEGDMLDRLTGVLLSSEALSRDVEGLDRKIKEIGIDDPLSVLLLTGAVLLRAATNREALLRARLEAAPKKSAASTTDLLGGKKRNAGLVHKEDVAILRRTNG